MEIYENTVGVHTFELNLRLSGFDEYRERAAQLYDEASDILNESGKGVYSNRPLKMLCGKASSSRPTVKSCGNSLTQSSRRLKIPFAMKKAKRI